MNLDRVLYITPAPNWERLNRIFSLSGQHHGNIWQVRSSPYTAESSYMYQIYIHDPSKEGAKASYLASSMSEAEDWIRGYYAAQSYRLLSAEEMNRLSLLG